MWRAAVFTCFVEGFQGVKKFMSRAGDIHFLEEGDNTDLFFHR
jgi:hypothetical protein